MPQGAILGFRTYCGNCSGPCLPLREYLSSMEISQRAPGSADKDPHAEQMATSPEQICHTFYQKPEFRKTERNVLMRSRHLDRRFDPCPSQAENFRPALV